MVKITLCYLIRDKIPPVQSLHFTTRFAKELLLAGTSTGKIYAYDTNTLRQEKELGLNAGTSSCISIQSVLDRLITQNRGGVVHVWSCEERNWTSRHTFNLDYSGFCQVDFNEMENVLVCPHNRSIIDIYSLKTEEKCMVLQLEGKELIKLGEIMYCKCIQFNGMSYILTAYEGGKMHLWDMRSQKSVSELAFSTPPTSVSFDDKSGTGLYGSTTKKVYYFALDINGQLKHLSYWMLTDVGVSCIKFSPHKNVVAISSWSQSIFISSWPDCTFYKKRSEHRSFIPSLCYSTESTNQWDSSLLMGAGSMDCQISLWDVT